MERKTALARTESAMLEIIQNGGYAVGDKLPTEVQFMQQLGVGRNTVREAMRALASRNIVEVRQGAGCFLSAKQGVASDPLGLAMLSDRTTLAQELLQVRILMEPEIAALAAQHATAEDIAVLETLLQEFETLAAQTADFSANDQAFHTQIAKCTHNQVIMRLLPVITDGVLAFRDAVDTPEYHYTRKSHRALVAAIAAHDAIEAKQIMSYHLLYNKQRWQEQTEIE